VFVLERVFQLLAYQPLLQQLLLALTCPGSSSSNGTSCRSCLLDMLASGQAYPAVAVLRMLVAVLDNRHMPAELLAALSVLPHKQQQQQHVACAPGNAGCQQDTLAQLVQATLAAAGAGAQRQGTSMLSALTQHYLPQQQPGGAAADMAAGCGPARHRHQRSSSSSSSVGMAADSLAALEACLQKQQSSGSGQQGGVQQSSSSLHAGQLAPFSSFGPQLMQQLQRLLLLPALPPVGLWLLGWLLHQLLPLSPASVAAAASGAGASAAASTAASTVAAAAAAEAAGDEPAAGCDAAALDGTSRQASGAGGGDPAHAAAAAGASASTGRSRRSSACSSSGSSDAGWQPRHRVGASGGGGSDVDHPLAAQLPPVSTQRAQSVQSNLCFSGEPRACLLSPELQRALQQALAQAHAAFGGQLSSMWCEAVFPMLALEWTAARDMLLRPLLRAGSHALLSGTAAWPLLRAQQRQHQAAAQQQQQAGRSADGLSTSALAALECYAAVQRVVALTQLHEVRLGGCAACQGRCTCCAPCCAHSQRSRCACLLPAAPAAAVCGACAGVGLRTQLLRVGSIACSPPVPTVSEADLKQVDVQEGYQVDLAPGSALPCVVSFAPGQERRVFFAGAAWCAWCRPSTCGLNSLWLTCCAVLCCAVLCCAVLCCAVLCCAVLCCAVLCCAVLGILCGACAVAGLSRKQLAALQGQPTSEGGGGTQATSSPGSSAAPAAGAAAAAAAANHASLLRSLPVAVLADPSPSRPQAGVVLSVAPLLGARPYADGVVPKWLHVHVRPSVRGLLRILKVRGLLLWCVCACCVGSARQFDALFDAVANACCCLAACVRWRADGALEEGRAAVRHAPAGRRPLGAGLQRSRQGGSSRRARGRQVGPAAEPVP
jgi:hypothetical protein